LDAAEEHALLAVDHHMKVPMPFEMAPATFSSVCPSPVVG
jgi:hypothetical protein